MWSYKHLTQTEIEEIKSKDMLRSIISTLADEGKITHTTANKINNLLYSIGENIGKVLFDKMSNAKDCKSSYDVRMSIGDGKAQTYTISIEMNPKIAKSSSEP